MGCSDSLQGSCRRHPSPARSPGVCSACLRERLSLLSDSDRRLRLAAAPSSSGEASPALARRHHQRNASEAIGSARFAFAGAALTKSRSMAVAAGAKSQSLRYAAFPIGGEREKKVGFWAKLIGGASRKSHGAAKHHRKGFREGIESGI